MKDTGKIINGVGVYSDPTCPPNTFYMMPKSAWRDKYKNSPIHPLVLTHPYLIYRKTDPTKLDMRYTRNKEWVETHETLDDLSSVQVAFKGSAPRRTGELHPVEDQEVIKLVNDKMEKAKNSLSKKFSKRLAKLWGFDD